MINPWEYLQRNERTQKISKSGMKKKTSVWTDIKLQKDIVKWILSMNLKSYMKWTNYLQRLNLLKLEHEEIENVNNAISNNILYQRIILP